MIQDSDAKAIDRITNLLTLIKHDGDSIFKIIGLVQSNQDFFEASLSSSCLKCAADKLEKLIEESKK